MENIYHHFVAAEAWSVDIKGTRELSRVSHCIFSYYASTNNHDKFIGKISKISVIMLPRRTTS